jgi:3',5'-nucleoside bisphosphate phosphatase
MSKKANKIKKVFSQKTAKNKALNNLGIATVDLHTHTIRSFDGKLSVAQLLQHALDNNVKTLAITDHNNLEGVKKALNFIKADKEKYKDLNFITGVEISCLDTDLNAKFHMTVYDFDVNNEELNKKLQAIRKCERQHYYHLFTKLSKNFDINFTPYEIIKSFANNNQVGLNEIAKMAVLHIDEKGNPAPYAKSPQDFIRSIKSAIALSKQFENKQNDLMVEISKYDFKDIGKTPYPSLDEILPIIKAAGGIPVLAHPENITFRHISGDKKEVSEKEGEKIIAQFAQKTASYGIDAGMEVFFPSHKKSQYYLNLAKKHNLLISGGSDFHGSHKNYYHRIGTVSNEYYLKQLPIIDYLSNRRVKANTFEPKLASECIATIPDRVKNLYGQKNQLIASNNKLKQAQKIKEVLKIFKENPYPSYKLDERFLHIKKRNRIIELAKNIKDFINQDRILLNKCEKNRQICLDQINLLQGNYKCFTNFVKQYNCAKIDFEKTDSLENKEAFSKQINNNFKTFNKQYELAIKRRRKMYKNFNIDIKKTLNKVEKKQYAYVDIEKTLAFDKQ